MEINETYSNADTVRWIRDISRDGSILSLDDGSRWHVVPANRLTSQNWHRTLVLRVTHIQGLTHDLRAQNEQAVLASFLGFQPMFDDGMEKVEAVGTEDAEPDPAAQEAHGMLKSEAHDADI